MPPWERESTRLFMRTDGQFWKFHGLKGMGLSVQPSWVPFSGSSGPRHSEVQSQGDGLTESLAQRRGCLISEPLEEVEGGLWHLSGQAAGEQSQPSSSDCSHTVCF